MLMMPAKRQDYMQAITFYKKSLEADAGQTRLLANVAVAYHSLGSYEQALEYYRLRIDQGVDSSSASILKNAGWAALNFAEQCRRRRGVRGKSLKKRAWPRNRSIRMSITGRRPICSLNI